MAAQFSGAKSGKGSEVTFYVDADRNIPVSGFADLKSLGLGFLLLENISLHVEAPSPICHQCPRMLKNVRLHGGAGRIPGRQALLLGQVCLIAQLLTDLLRKQYNRLTNASSKLISKYYRLFTLFLDIISMPAVLNCFNR